MSVRADVLHRSKTGYVRRYAEWIFLALAGDLCDAREFDAEVH